MALTVEQQNLIKIIDDRVTSVMLVDGTDREMVASVFDLMPGIKDLIDSKVNQRISESEMQSCYERYEGFYKCMKFLEKLAEELSAKGIEK